MEITERKKTFFSALLISIVTALLAALLTMLVLRCLHALTRPDYELTGAIAGLSFVLALIALAFPGKERLED